MGGPIDKSSPMPPRMWIMVMMPAMCGFQFGNTD